MLYESNRPKYLFNKYCTLIIAFVILSAVVSYIFKNHNAIEFGGGTIVEMTIILIIFIVCIWIYLKYKNKWKMVSIGKMKIVIEEKSGDQEYSWLDVEYISLDSILGYYTLKLKNKDEILFTPYGFTTLLFGDQSEMGDIINKMKKDLSI